ncbi:hypothetical protein ACOMHN_047338 [Nucella lapillus]
MPEFKLKKMFGKSHSSSRSPKQSPSHHGGDLASGDSGNGRRKERSQSPHTMASPEHHGPTVSGYESRSSLSGSSFSGGGSKSNSLERQSHTGSDGGISSMSGSGTDDSGHSSMSSPLNLPMEQLQSFNAVYRVGQAPSTSSPYQLNIQGPPKNIGKQQVSQSRHGLSKIMNSLSTAASDRFFDRKENDRGVYGDGAVRSEHSPDRNSQRKQPSFGSGNERDHNTSSYTSLGNDPLLDRESVCAGGSENGGVPEPRSVDHAEEMSCQSLQLYDTDVSQEDYRNKIIFELQWQVAELHERCAQQQKEADLARDRLGSSMHSVSTFWSPELKKERTLRKEEAARCYTLFEQLVVRQAELQQVEVPRCVEPMASSQPARAEDRCDGSGQPARAEDRCAVGSDMAAVPEDQRVGEREQGLLEQRVGERERGLLEQRVGELQKHLETQKQTLTARDASIKTLLDMLQGKKEGGQWGQSEQDCLQTQAAINANRISELEATLQAKETHLHRLKQLQDAHASQSPDSQQSASASHPLSAMIHAKDSQIRSLEKEVCVLEEKMLRSEEDVVLGSYRHLCADHTGGRGKLLHHEVQKVRDDLSDQERQVCGAQRHAASLQHQHQDTLQQLTALQHQLADREQQAAALQTEVGGLQERIRSKDGMVERKRQENQALKCDRQTLEAELAELRDQLDSREHQITVLRRKVGHSRGHQITVLRRKVGHSRGHQITVLRRKAEMCDDVLREKDEQLCRARSRQTCVPTIESPTYSPEDALAERDRQIERLQALQSQCVADHQEELDLYAMTSQDLHTQMGAMRFELAAKQAEVRELREEAGRLRGQRAHREARLRQLEASTPHASLQSLPPVSGPVAACLKLPYRTVTGCLVDTYSPSGSLPYHTGQSGYSQVFPSHQWQCALPYRTVTDCLVDTYSQVDPKELTCAQTQTDALTPSADMWSSTDESLSGGVEVRCEGEGGPSLLQELQGKVEAMEQEAQLRQRQVDDLQDVLQEHRGKVGTLKRSQLKDKEKNAQLLQAARKREDSFTDDASHRSTEIEEKETRIRELEDALRESVRITAQREMDMMELQTQIGASTAAMEEMRGEVEAMRASSRDYTSKLATLSRQLDDKDAKIGRLAAHQHYHIQELYEIKQEAVRAAIGDKEASLAVLELSGAKKPRQQDHVHYLRLEKHRLQATLIDVTQSLARLREGQKRGSGSTGDCSAAGAEVRPGVGVTGKKNCKDGSTTL